MKRRRGSKIAGGVAAVLLGAGCRTIHEDGAIRWCPDSQEAMVEATVDPGASGYNQFTDPGWLAVEQYARAQEIMESDNQGLWEANLRNQVVGLGTIACLGADGQQVYLTTEGAALSLELQAEASEA